MTTPGLAPSSRPSAGISLAPPESVGMSTERLERLGGWLRETTESGKLAGASVLVGRRGQPCFAAASGMASIETGAPFTLDTVVRIYSMTKPITTVAAMMLYERGAFQLDDPIAKYLPAFSKMQVWRGGPDLLNASPAASPITVRQLMIHTAGFSYDFMHATPVDAAYRAAGVDMKGAQASIADWVDALAEIPLMAEPGAAWNYSVATDVLGRLVEVWSGRSLAGFFEAEVLGPLGMTDTAFSVRPENQARFAALYGPETGGDLSAIAAGGGADGAPRGGLALLEAAEGSPFCTTPSVFYGGGGLVGTIGDYARFCQMLLNGGALGDARLLSPTTLRFMLRNQLGAGRDMAAMGQPVWSETSYAGIGFGLGGAVVIDPVAAELVASPGEYHWGGAASTFFFIDPAEELFTVFFTQLIPSSTYPLRRELRRAVYQAVIG